MGYGGTFQAEGTARAGVQGDESSRCILGPQVGPRDHAEEGGDWGCRGGAGEEPAGRREAGRAREGPGPVLSCGRGGGCTTLGARGVGGRRSGDQQVVGLLGTAAGQHGGRRGWGWDRRSPRYRCLGFWLLRRLRQHRASSTSLRSGKEEGRKGGRKEEGNRGRKKEGREGGRAGGGERGDSPSTSTEHVCSEAPSDLSFKRLSGLQRGGGLAAAGPGPRRGLPTPEITLVPLVPQSCVVRAKGRLSRWGGPAEWGCRARVQSRRPGVLGVYPTQLLSRTRADGGGLRPEHCGPCGPRSSCPAPFMPREQRPSEARGLPGPARGRLLRGFTL